MKKYSISKIYFFRFPGLAYSWNWYATNKEEAKKQIREYLKVKRLPDGFEIWENKQ